MWKIEVSVKITQTFHIKTKILHTENKTQNITVKIKIWNLTAHLSKTSFKKKSSTYKYENWYRLQIQCVIKWSLKDMIIIDKVVVWIEHTFFDRYSPCWMQILGGLLKNVSMVYPLCPWRICVIVSLHCMKRERGNKKSVSGGSIKMYRDAQFQMDLRTSGYVLISNLFRLRTCKCVEMYNFIWIWKPSGYIQIVKDM